MTASPPDMLSKGVAHPKGLVTGLVGEEVESYGA